MTEAAWRRRFRAPRISLPSWARDEPERLLYASNESGKWELYAWDRARDLRVRLTDRPEGTLYGLLDPRGRFVWWFDDEKGSEFGRWMRQPFPNDGDVRPAAVSNGGLPKAYSAGIAIANDLAIVGSSRDGRTSVHVVRDSETPQLVYENEQDADVTGVSRDESLWCLSHSEHGDSRHPALRLLTIDGERVGDLWDGEGKGLAVAGWSRIPGDQRLLVVHERRDLPRPLIWHAESGDTTEIDIDLPGEVDVDWYPNSSALLVLHFHRGRTELHRLDLRTGALTDIDVPTGSIENARVRPDGELWYSWNDSATPPELRAGGSVLLRPGGEPAPAGVRYSDHDVEGIHLFVAEPQSDGPHATVFLIHGGPEWHDSDRFSPTVQAWVDHGFAVVLVNYRGSTGYGKEWRDALEGNPGFTELEDIGKVHDWVIREGIADTDRVVLAGGSWGGYLTLLGLGTQAERWALGIAAVPVADYVAAFEDEMEPLKGFDRALFGGSPDEKPDLYRDRSPITYVERVRVPVMILAGENDPRCPIRQIQNYIGRLEELGKSHEVYRYDAGHGSLKIDEQIRQLEVQIAFASKHLGTLPPQ